MSKRFDTLEENTPMHHRILTYLLVLLATQLMSQSGTVVQSLEMHSETLSENVKYSVYLPPGYHTSDESYPIVYLLHGYGGDETSWVVDGDVNRITSAAIDTGLISPMVIIMPNADNTWYVNDIDGNYKWSDMFFEELLPFVEDTFRIKAEKKYRGVAGLSMGGHGALLFSLQYPELFAGCVALSAGLWTEEAMLETPIANYNKYFGHIFGMREENNPLSDHFTDNCVLTLMENDTIENLKTVAYWIDCGDDDFLTQVNAELHILMKEREIPHEYRVRDGAHTWEYWRTGLTPGLMFLSQQFDKF